LLDYIKKRILEDTEKKLIRAFNKVDSDMLHLRKWMSHLNQKTSQLADSHNYHVSLTNRDLDNMNKWLSYLNSHNSDLKRYVADLTHAISEIAGHQKKVYDRLDALEKKIANRPQQFTSSVRTEPRTEPVRKSSFTDRIASEALMNRKNYALKLIISMASQKKYSTVQVEKFIVEEKRLCGRTTFYSYLKELRSKGVIEDISIGSRLILASTQT